MEIVDPRFYRNFCLRGVGKANFVISAKGEKDGVRIVWRLAKHRRSGFISAKQKCQLLHEYIHRLIAPFIGEEFLVTPRIVRMHVSDLITVAKIPSLPHNVKVDSFYELDNANHYPPSLSLFPERYSRLVPTYPFIDLFEMSDVTRIPKRISNTFGPTITIEIKPKQGFFQKHPGIEVPYCNNCILQIEKCHSAAFDQMYDFCPLELYSGNYSRMFNAMSSLIDNPHRNLRIFLDGDPVHDDETVLTRSELEALISPNSSIQVDLLIKALCHVLAGVQDDTDDFYLRDHSILATLLRAQKIDPIGLVKAREIYESLPSNVKGELLNKNNFIKRANSGFLSATDPRSLLERYLLAATLKDCSLMISFRVVTVGDSNGYSNLLKLRPTTASDAPALFLNYAVRVVDCDFKSIHNLLNGYNRFITGVNVIRDSPCLLHKPCQI
ncbi:Inositol-pentakisphosphate 2-kinase [Aphelenchoides besseyi]|nr:Inositol-pentakisphosphate 2-kinase [Aphelenchoides besseyi]KAI6228117.1 Inositol-pentakisphosphate 2-kinase [Aphelenchoides besseyi]